ncbi:MAG: response regulator [Bacteroidota bacterium]|nr:response regulator [Bacteroidota bacterium]
MKKILILEDDIDISNVLRMILAEEGFATISSACTLSADDVYAIKPDLLILDNWLLDGHGSELCSQLKKNPLTSRIPVMLASAAYNLDQMAAECRADAYLEKPFDLDEMVGMIHMMIDRAQNRTDNE